MQPTLYQKAFFYALNAAALALPVYFLCSLPAWRGRLRPACAAGAAMLAWTSLLLFYFTPEVLRNQGLAWLFTVLHEGNTGRLLDAVYGTVIDTGPNFYAIQALFSTTGLLPAWNVLHLNIWLGGLSLIMAAAYSFAFLETPVFALLALGLYARSHLLLNAAVSELPLALTGFYMFASLPLFAAVRLAPPGRKSLAAAAGITVLTFLSAMTRPETLIVWLPACAAAFMMAAGLAGGLGERLQKLYAPLRSRFTGLRPWPALMLAVAAAVLARQLGLLIEAQLGVYAADSFDAVNLLDLSFLTLPFFISHISSIGAALVLALGIAAGLKDTLRLFFVPLTGLILYQACWSASSFTFTGLIRTTPVLLPLIFLGIVRGMRAIEKAAAGYDRRGPAAAACALLLLVPGAPGARQLLAGGDQRPPGSNWKRTALISMSQQLEGRYALEKLGKYADDFVITRSVNPHEGNCPEQYLIISRERQRPEILGCSWEEARARLSASGKPQIGRRMIFYRGGDCNIAYTTAGSYHPADPLCALETAGAAKLEETTFTNVQYNSIHGYTQNAPVITLGFYELKF